MNTPEEEIMELIGKCSSALNDKNLDALFEHIADDVELFDVVTQTSGVSEYRKLWEQCLSYFGDKVGTERKDVKIHAGEDVAFVHCYTRVTGVKSDNENAKSWLRTTICLEKVNGAWKIAHEHISLPFDIETKQPVFIMD